MKRTLVSVRRLTQFACTLRKSNSILLYKLVSINRFSTRSESYFDENDREEILWNIKQRSARNGQKTISLNDIKIPQMEIRQYSIT